MAFVKNKHGAIHSIPDEWLVQLLRDGFQPATNEEVREWYRTQGLNPPGDVEVINDGESKHGTTDQPGEKSHRRPSRH